MTKLILIGQSLKKQIQHNDSEMYNVKKISIITITKKQYNSEKGERRKKPQQTHQHL